VEGAQLPFRLVAVTAPEALPPLSAIPAAALAPAVRQPTNLIGPNDLLNITIFEAGVSLFGRPSALGTRAARSTSSGSTVNTEQLPGMRVDDQGYIQVPFVGRVRAAGRTTTELQEAIRRGLVGKSQAPQVVVTVDESITNSLVLAGEVNRPGRVPLTTARESLADTVALAGGYRGEAKDLVARVERGSEQFEIRFSDLMDLPERDVPVGPGDRITLISRPQSFSVLGAPNRAEQIRFPRGRISLAEAVALAGGANAAQGDAAAIFVFRYLPTQSGGQEPVVYHVNMMRPNALLLAQRFAMRDRDLLYIGNAQANQPSKLIQLLSQLFVPVTVVRGVGL
jgi:polysaccharide export outer membrane protein